MLVGYHVWRLAMVDQKVAHVRNSVYNSCACTSRLIGIRLERYNELARSDLTAQDYM